MKYLLSAAALLATTVVADKRDLCSDGSVDDNKNWYCQNVTAITYTGVGGSGSYNRVTNMDSTGGACSSSPQGYSGSMSPLDEEVRTRSHARSWTVAGMRGVLKRAVEQPADMLKVSLHFRGPLNLKQFAVYTPSQASVKKMRRDQHMRQHARRNARGHQHHARAVGDMVTATINDVVETWINEWSGEATSAPVTSSNAAGSSSTSLATSEEYAASSSSQTSSAAFSTATAAGPGSIGSSTGGWGRQGYYDSSSGAEGLVFLNHNGGSGSGVFDYTFGNSLSYASSDGCSGSSAAQNLSDTTLPSSAEVVIMTDNECSGDDCGYTRTGTVAYHGFDGPSKAFFFEFTMPDSGETATSEYDPVNMPAIWMLNAQIPRTLQYGQADCSCWTSGCGEFDIFEVLAPGDTRMKSTLHGNIAGGDSDYFDRPQSGSMKGALVLYNNNIHIKVLDNSTEFGSTMAADIINEICGSTMTQTNTVSLFALGD